MIYLFILFSIGAVFSLSGAIFETKTNKKISQQINQCFEGVDLTNQSFSCNGAIIYGIDGETKFYRKTQVDILINRLNELRGRLRVKEK